ncbi:MAG: putative ABC transporter permease [Ruminococcus sp.]|nr:putative ABC transporter permease [Ruminococcus sp.]
MGYFLYSLIEILNRGYTHWTMSLTGGFILAVLYALNSTRGITLLKSCFIGSVIITATEFTVGVFDNIIMHWNVWDYSEMPFNVSGQICLLFSCYWFLLCIPAYYLCGIIRRKFSVK